MRLSDILALIDNTDLIIVEQDGETIYKGYKVCTDKEAYGGKLFEKGLPEDMPVKGLICLPEIKHRRWKELGLMAPLTPEQTPDYEFADLQLTIYYKIEI